jgi:hypothetical protein
MADSKADKDKVAGKGAPVHHQPVDNTKLNEPDFSGDVEGKAKTTVAREQGDPKAQADNLAASGDPQDDVAATGNLGFGHGDVNPVTATDRQLEKANVSTDEQERIDALPNVKVYNPNAGLSPRVGGPYLDNVELEQAEIKRAVFENREPDFENMAGTAGVPLWTAGQLAAAHNGGPALAQMIDDNADNEKLGPKPIGEVPMVGENLDVVEVAEGEKKARREWDNTKVTSHDQPGVVFTQPVVGQGDK